MDQGSPGSAGSEPEFAGRQEILLELFTHRFGAVAAEMGEMLQRTALSTNVRERLDFSCALLDPDGYLVVNAPHIPVHLGALGLCVRRLASEVDLRPGDTWVTNHPGYGGSHLPDVTLVTAVYEEAVYEEAAHEEAVHEEAVYEDEAVHHDKARLLGYVASRSHHAEIGGKRPGSMPPDAVTLVEEGVVIPPTLLKRGDEVFRRDMDALLRDAPFPSRSPAENLADLDAALAANLRGARALQDLARSAGHDTVVFYMGELRRLAADKVEKALQALPIRHGTAEETLDDGHRIRVEIDLRGDRPSIRFDGTDGVHPGNLNATPAIVRSAVLYVLRWMLDEDLPLNEGLLDPLDLHVPEGSFLNPPFVDDAAACPAVVGGNVETSQRVVDTLLKALGLQACSQGTMNNLLFGNAHFGYYETVCGGAGAGPEHDGESAVHTHMTNTRITDPEVLERRFPVRLERFAVRQGSGGAGRRRGGDGAVRELTFLEPVQVSVLTQHRVEAPYGLNGGEPGARGRQRVVRADGREQVLDGIDQADLEAGDRLVLETPGGGGFGRS